MADSSTDWELQRIEPLVNRVREISKPLTSLLPVAQLLRRLDEADRRRSRKEYSNRPLVVAFLGPTGAGKSTLFNAMIGKQISPTSSVERCFTKTAQIACPSSARASLSFLDLPGSQWHFVDDPKWSSTALIDTPDIDGMRKENKEIAHRFIEEADVVIFVVDPDRRSNLTILRELARWSDEKEWLFALTKLDRVERAEVEAVTADFDQRLRECGFEVSNDTRFLTSIHQNGTIKRIRDRLMKSRTTDDLRCVKAINHLGYYRHAVANEVVDPLSSLHATIVIKIKEETKKIQDGYAKQLSKIEIRQQLSDYLLSQTWVKMVPLTPGPMKLPVWIRAKISLLTQSWGVYRMTGGVIGLIGVAIISAMDIIRGLLPLQNVFTRIRPELVKLLNESRVCCDRLLEDLRLDSVQGVQKESPATSNEGPIEQTLGTVKLGWISVPLPSVERIVRSLRDMGLIENDDELFVAFYQQIQTLAYDAARRVLRPWVGVGINLLVIAAIVHIGWRMARSWWFESYPSFEFYIAALVVLLFACIPGYFALVWLVNRQHQDIDVIGVASEIRHPSSVEKLGVVSKMLEEYVRHTVALRTQLDQLRITMLGESTSTCAIRVGEQAEYLSDKSHLS